MIAQVNLYHACFRRKHLLLPFRHMLIIAGISLLSIPALLVYDQQQRRDIANYSAALEHQYQSMEKQWSSVQETMKAKVINKQMTSEANKLKTILNYRRELLQLINNSGFALHDSHPGYSDYMIALARQHLPDLWLTHIGIARNGTELEIEGNTRDAESVTKYLQRLTKEQALAGTKLEIFKIDSEDAKSSTSEPLHFIMASSRDGK